MQGILSFDDNTRVSKRRKGVRACQRCKDFKKKCCLTKSELCCDRCGADNHPCSFAATWSTNSKQPLQKSSGFASNDEFPSYLNTTESSFRNYATQEADRECSAPMNISLQSEYPGTLDRTISDQTPDVLMTPITNTSDDAQEYRYATMLSLMSKSDTENPKDRQPPVKLISGTNPLSALLGKDLKHTIVTNSCSFRTPDPIGDGATKILRTGSSFQSCDWEGYFASHGISAPRLRFMREVGCFNFPPPTQCSQLLEIYFKHIHPVLPVIDRKEFLSAYYGSDNPPPLILLQAVFLAASRYIRSEGGMFNGIPEVRGFCDELHTKVRSLIDAEITHQRLAVIQASLIASLHWEGREGLNSALDSLSLAVRAGQEMGLHRKKGPSPHPQNSEQDSLHRRIWWCVYTLDRMCAAQEGTPFLINEKDCDIEPLTPHDLNGEDSLTSEVALISISMAQVIESAVRYLYQPPEDSVLSSSGVEIRQRLLANLDTINDRITLNLLSGIDVKEALRYKTLSVQFGAFLQTHLDAIRILVYRPFLLYAELPGQGIHISRNACRQHAKNIVTRLNLLLEPDMLRYSWPFTVYAVVNCLLIFWYDVSSPMSTDQTTTQTSRKEYLDVVNLLRVMGHTWWAAAAKHKLALALAQAAVAFHSQGRENTSTKLMNEVPSSSNATPVPGATNKAIFSSDCGLNPVSLLPSANGLHMNVSDCDEQNIDIFSGYDGIEYWSSLGLDFDMDVAANIFSIDMT